MPAHTPEEIHDLIAAAFNEGDLDAFVALHEDGAATLVPPDGRRATGHSEIRAALEPIFALRPTARIEVLGKLQTHELAVTHARVHVAAAAAAFEGCGRGTR